MKTHSSLDYSPVEIQDPPKPLPKITQAELLLLADAECAFKLARADYEMKRAAVTFKLLFADPEPGILGAKLDPLGNFVLLGVD